jgi:type IV pilus assembly protein PilB
VSNIEESATVIFFRKNVERDEEDEEEERELISFQGAANGRDADLESNKKLVSIALEPAKELVSDALEQKSEMLKLDPVGDKAVTSFFIDGIKSAGPRFPLQKAVAITQILKLLAGLDITIKDKPQRGAIKAKYRDLPFEVTIKTAPGKGAEQLTVMYRMTKTRRDRPEDIGIPEVVKKAVRDNAAKKEGVILIVGPPESGLTTTALCTLRCVDSYLFQCFILGDMQGREVQNVPEFKRDPEHDLATTIERIKRQEGDVVYFARFDDAELIREATKGSHQVCVMSEMVARDAAEGVTKFADIIGERDIAADRLRCVVGFRLIRKLCTKCREAFRPSPRLLAQVGLPENTATLYREAREPEPDPKTGELPEPCSACDGTGYRGRAAVFELIQITDGIKEVMIAGGDAAAIKAKAREEKQLTCQKDALRLVADGTTGLEELQRVFAPPAKKKAAPPRKPPQEK